MSFFCNLLMKKPVQARAPHAGQLRAPTTLQPCQKRRWMLFATAVEVQKTRTALLRAHAAQLPTEIVDRIVLYAAPNVETLRRSFDAYLAEFMETDNHLSHTPCCNWLGRQTKKLHERLLIRINDQDSVAVYNHPYKYFLSAHRSLQWFNDVIDGNDVLSKSTLKIYLKNPRHSGCPRQCSCCLLLHIDNVDSPFWSKKLRDDLLSAW